MTRLPPGRHKLSRAEVRESQRRRLREAAAAVLREQGYARITTTAVARRAGVSTATLYRHHGDLWDCLLDAHAAAAAALCERIEAACARVGGTATQELGVAAGRAGIAAALAALGADPARAHLLSLEPPSSASDLWAARRRLIERLGAMLARTSSAPGRGDRDRGGHPREERLVAAAMPLVAARTRVGAEGGLDDLGPTLAPLLLPAPAVP